MQLFSTKTKKMYYISIIEKIKQMLSKESIEKIKSAITKLGIELPATKVVKLADLPVKDETGADVVLSIDGDKPEVGMNVMVGTSPAMDGEYMLADGSSITVMAGVISEIGNKANEVAEDVVNPMDALMSRLSALEENYKNLSATNTTLSAELAETKNALSVSLSTIDEMNNVSVALSLESQKPVKTEIEYSKLSNFQKYQLEKYGELK